MVNKLILEEAADLERWLIAILNHGYDTDDGPLVELANNAITRKDFLMSAIDTYARNNDC